jgi:hypothetical protein
MDLPVTDETTINLGSLSIIREELLTAIKQTGANLEQFISNRDKEEFQQSTLEGLKELNGVFRIIQLDGADTLTGEMVELLTNVPVSANESYDQALSVLSTGFFLLPRYFEYSQQSAKCVPVLLLPFINDLRIASGKSPLWESEYFNVNTTAPRPNPPAASMPSGDEQIATLRRLRHMYQVGLLGILKGNKASYSLGVMKRAMDRMDKLSGNKPLGRLWWLASAALGAMEEKKMQISTTRKFLFSSVDRSLKKVLKNGESALDEEPSEVTIKELVYLTAISGSDAPLAKEVRQAFGVPPMPMDDAKIQQEMDNLRGPEMATIHSVADVIRDELKTTKARLEAASEGGMDMQESYPEIIDSLTKVTDILAVVGLETASGSLKEQNDKFREWQSSGHNADKDQLLEAADAMLYVESTVSTLEKINLSPEKLAEANSLARDEVIATSHLAEAEKVVVEEARSGLSLIKRAITSFQESNFDKNHIANLSKSLNAVRGAMVVLNMSKAADICGSCIRFVDQDLIKGDNTETFADAVISFEYYLENYADVGIKDDTVLEIAEESVQALGYPVGAKEEA